MPAPTLVWPELLACATLVSTAKRTQFDFAEEVGDEGAISAFLFLARDEDGEPADLVAWAPRENRLAAWFGTVALLGAEDLWAPRLTKERALPVFETPLGWLRAGREGVVVIDRRGAAPPLRLAEPLVAELIEHGEKLRCMLKVQPPRIFVANPDVRSAADRAHSPQRGNPTEAVPQVGRRACVLAAQLPLR